MPWLPSIASNIVLALALAVVAWFVQRGLGRHAIARILWLLVLVKLVTPPLLSVPLGASSGEMACALGTCGCEPHALAPPVVRDAFRWLLLALWSAGAGVTAWIAWRRWNAFRRFLAHAAPAPAPWQSLADRLGSELSLWRRPEVLAVPGRLPPLVVPGWRRPRILVPAALMDRLDVSRRAALLLHELLHVKRGDHLVRLLELAVTVVYWWLPFVGSIGRQLRTCEETCCDAAVLARWPQARRDYARLLLDVVDFANPLPRPAVPQATAMSAAGELERRLRGILRASGAPRRRAWPSAVLAVGMACLILPCQLRYDFSGRGTLRPPAAPATSADRPPAAVETRPSKAFDNVELLGCR